MHKRKFGQHDFLKSGSIFITILGLLPALSNVLDFLTLQHAVLLLWPYNGGFSLGLQDWRKNRTVDAQINFSKYVFNIKIIYLLKNIQLFYIGHYDTN